MTAQDYIYARLSAHPGLAALVETRISAGIALQGCERPYLTYQVFGTRPEYTHDGPQEMRDPEFQFDSIADDCDGAWAVNAQLMDALESSDSPLVGVYVFIENDGTYFYEEDTGRHRVMAQARVWYKHP